VHDQLASLLRLRSLPPTLPPGFVHRQRLLDQLNVGTARPVTVLSAGPGYGKTLTLASWYHQGATPDGAPPSGAAPSRVAWLAVEETDNDVPAFWSDVLGALTIGDAVPADSALRQVVPAAGFGAHEVLLIRAALADLPHTVVLVLDDIHHLTDRRVLESFGQLLEHQPPQLRLVLSTRADPALRLHRMRVNGEVTDIRAKDLAFTASEAAELFRGNGIHVSERQLGGLLDRTEGWAAGLRLALLSLDPGDIDGAISRFTGRDRLVAEYLIEEVTDQLPAQDRQFLLTTSVADRVSAGLADVLTGRSDSQQTLDRLVTDNALLVALAGRTDWFSVHPLLRDLLRYRLTREQPGMVTELHLRAAQWFADQGEPIEAIRHAAAARQWDEVGRLLTEQAWPLMVTPRGPALAAALEPAAARAAVEATSSTLLVAAVCHFHRHDWEAMTRAAEEATELMAGVPQVDRRAADALIAVLHIVHSRIRNPAATRAAAAHLLDVIDRTPRRHLPTAEQHRVIATDNLAIGQLWAGDLTDAETTLTTVLTQCQRFGLGLTELTTQAHLALLDVIRGRLPQAYRRAGAAHAVADRRGWASEPQALGLYASMAFTHLEWNQLDAAQQDVDRGVTVSGGGSDIACLIALAIADVEVAVARGDAAAAHAAAARLDTIQAQAGELPPLLAGWCAVAHADALLTAGKPDDAIERVNDGSEQTGFTAALRAVVLAKAQLLLDEPDAAVEMLEAKVVNSSPYRGPRIEGKVLAAVAADRTHRDTAALAAITQAVDLAQNVGIIRPFVAAGPRIGPLLTRHQHLVDRHRDFTRALSDATTGGYAPATTPAPAAAEALTERERTVLSYLPTMFKAAEIASDLYVTINTIKAHQRAIYRKLGVDSRRDAVDRARELNLL